MKIATLIGMSVLDFWELTPYEFALMVESYNKNKQEDQEEKMILTYMGAYWQRTKRMPNLKDLLYKKETPKKVMTPEDVLNQVKALNAQLGGETY